MGSHKVISLKDAKKRRLFVQRIIRDIEALEIMITEDMLENDAHRIGVEQELCLVDQTYHPAPEADRVIKKLRDDHYNDELAKFNLEINLDPITLGRDSFSFMEQQLTDYLQRLSRVAEKMDLHYVLTGILPTLRPSDLTMDNISPRARYKALNDAIINLSGTHHLRIQGTDELVTRDDSIMYESSTNSFQVHYQVAANEISSHYNWAQFISAPVLAACTNSPLFLGKRLWNETRVAMFRQCSDTRSNFDGMREKMARVFLGEKWVEDFVTDIHMNDLANHDVLLGVNEYQDSVDILRDGGIPKLNALSVFNGTLYKWNRTCYGIMEGKPHLRIENRYLPAGPSIVDEVANAAFWVGLMKAKPSNWNSLQEGLNFEDSKANFMRAARVGLDSHFHWLDGQSFAAQELILKELLPLSRQGLHSADIDPADIDKYLGLIEERVSTRRVGSLWLVESYNHLKKHGVSLDPILMSITSAATKQQKQNIPGHLWEPAQVDELGNGTGRFERIDQIMSRKLYTVNEEDAVDLAQSIMKWKNISHLLVENNTGELVGLISLSRLMLYYFNHRENGVPVAVKDFMVKDVITIPYYASTLEAIQTMKKHKIGSLPVVNESNKLVGIVTERDFFNLAEHLLSE